MGATDTAPAEAPGPSIDERADLAYKWTIRALYLVGIGANAWLAWEMYRDTPEGQRIAAKVSTWWRQASTPVREWREYRSKLNHVLFDAEWTLHRARVRPVDVPTFNFDPPGDDGGT